MVQVNNTIRALGLAAVLSLVATGLHAAEAAAEEADVVSLEADKPPSGEAPKAQPRASSSLDEPTDESLAHPAAPAAAVSTDQATVAPTVEATAAPTVGATAAATAEATTAPGSAPAAEPAPAATPAPKESLLDPGFDKSRASASADENDGIVIIAPGAASPEDSFEAFGIDSPFNWKEKKRRAISAPGETDTDASGEAIELNAPETSDFRDQVEVDDAGKPGSASEDYDTVERAGFILPSDEFRFDATVSREKNGRLIFGKGDLIFLQMEPGRQIYPGSVYTCFRDDGKVMGPAGGAELGKLLRAVCVVRIVRVDSEFIMARVDRQYDSGRVGDILRLRDPDRARHFSSLRQNAGEAPAADLRGAVAELENRKLTIRAGQNAYLDIGRSQGVLAGMKLMIYRELSLQQDPTRLQPGPVGKIGELQVISTQKSTCTARLIKATSAVGVGDKVRYR